MPAKVIARLARDLDSARRKNRKRTEQGAVMLAAIKTMADADTTRCAVRNQPDASAQATPDHIARIISQSLGKNTPPGEFVNI